MIVTHVDNFVFAFIYWGSTVSLQWKTPANLLKTGKPSKSLASYPRFHSPNDDKRI